MRTVSQIVAVRHRGKRWIACIDCKETFKRLPNRTSAVCPNCCDHRRQMQLEAMSRVSLAVRNGYLPRVSTLKCVDCGAQAAAYEHRDYSKPLEVEAVCRPCNRKRGPASLGEEKPRAHIFFAQTNSCSPHPTQGSPGNCGTASQRLTEKAEMPKRPKIDTAKSLEKRWLALSPEMADWSAKGPIWLQIAGAAEPVMWVRPVSMLDAKRIGASKWAKYLVTDGLSRRELEIFMLLASGQSVTDAAASMYLSVKTVSTYRSRIVEKTGLKNNVEMAMYAYRFGLVEWKREAEYAGSVA